MSNIIGLTKKIIKGMRQNRISQTSTPIHHQNRKNKIRNQANFFKQDYKKEIENLL